MANGSNVIRLKSNPDPEFAEGLIADAAARVEEDLKVTLDTESRRNMSQALVHLHEAQLLLSWVALRA